MPNTAGGYAHGCGVSGCGYEVVRFGIEGHECAGGARVCQVPSGEDPVNRRLPIADRTGYSVGLRCRARVETRSASFAAIIAIAIFARLRS